MNELEMQIGRILGASCFFIYQTVKANPNFSAIDIQIETGLSECCVWTALDKLHKSKVLARQRRNRGNLDKAFVYVENREKETWKLH